jgi:selenide,water dikinase
LEGLKVSDDPDLLVGYDTSDDAAVYRVAPDIALISTVDYITPPVDDPYWFGQIAAANSLSDVYAMGGQPLTCLNLVMFPSKILAMDMLKEILKGGNSKVREAGASMAGGHSVDDNEPKYGLAVTGSVHPDRILTNKGCRAGDALVLTKPLGTGVLFNAGRSGKLPYPELESILPQVAALNGKAMEVALKFDIHACTDVTGFGILGHSLEMALGSGLQINLTYDRLSFYPNAIKMYQKGESTGSNKANRRLAQGRWEPAVSMTTAQEELLFDPQTSGGLLLALPEGQCPDLLTGLKDIGIEAAAYVGDVVESPRPFVRVV